jgi:hypothetical protein
MFTVLTPKQMLKEQQKSLKQNSYTQTEKLTSKPPMVSSSKVTQQTLL